MSPDPFIAVLGSRRGEHTDYASARAASVERAQAKAQEAAQAKAEAQGCAGGVAGAAKQAFVDALKASDALTGVFVGHAVPAEVPSEFDVGVQGVSWL